MQRQQQPLLPAASYSCARHQHSAFVSVLCMYMPIVPESVRFLLYAFMMNSLAFVNSQVAMVSSSSCLYNMCVVAA